MRFLLVSAQGTKFDGEVYEVLVPTKAGAVGVFEGHMPMISAAMPGVLSVRKNSTDPDSHLEHFAVNGGVLEVDGKAVKFVADDITASEEASEAQAAEAMERAEELVAKADNQTALHEAKRMLHHSTAQLQVAKLKKRHHR